MRLKNTTEKSIIEALRSYIVSCPLLSGKRVNVNYIGVKMSYSVDPLPCTPVLRSYVDGGTIRQFQFQFSSKELYDEDARINIENSGFYQKFQEWLEKKTDLENLNIGSDKTPLYFETTNSGYLYDVDGHDARYAIECRLIFEQK